MYEEPSEIEKMLLREQQEQKRIRTGVFHRASRTGKIRGMIRTPYAMLTGKAKKEYEKLHSGKEVTYYMYELIKLENVKSLEEIRKMPYELGRDYLINIRNKFNTKDLIKQWKKFQKINSYTIYGRDGQGGIFGDFNIPRLTGKNLNKEFVNNGGVFCAVASGGTIAATSPDGRTWIQRAFEKPLDPEVIVSKPESRILIATPQSTLEVLNGLTINCNGQYSGVEIQQRLEKYLLALDDNSKYKVVFTINELQE